MMLDLASIISMWFTPEESNRGEPCLLIWTYQNGSLPVQNDEGQVDIEGRNVDGGEAPPALTVGIH